MATQHNTTRPTFYRVELDIEFEPGRRAIHIPLSQNYTSPAEAKESLAFIQANNPGLAVRIGSFA